MGMFEYWNQDGREFVVLSTSDEAEIKEHFVKSNANIENLFVFNAETDRLLPIEELVPTRARVKGIINASMRMVEANKGSRNKRKPLSVKYKKSLDRYVILDGNSTYFVCRIWGINVVPCSVESLIVFRNGK